MKFGKIVGGGLGWAFGGPIGAILGYALGSMFDNMGEGGTDIPYADRNKKTGRTTSGDFAMSLLVLSAAVMKANGKVKKSELDFVKKFLTQQFGASRTKEYILALREILQKEIPLQQVCVQIRSNLSHPVRLQLMHYLFGIAQADGIVDGDEVNVVHTISRYLNISDKDFQSIKSMFYKDTLSDYKILHLEETASNEELKKAYRKMAIKYHPDKVSHLGEEFQKAAKEKFQKVQEAYENIKIQRGIN